MVLRSIRAIAGMGVLSLMVLGLASPVLADTRPGSFVVLTVSPQHVSTGGIATIQICMNGGLVGTIATTSSGHGTSGLKVTSPGPDPSNPGVDVTTWFYTPARLVVLPACDGQPLPPGCPTPPVLPGRDQSMECTNGTYNVSFGDSTPGWVQGIGPSVGQTSEQGTYTVNLDYIQNNNTTGAKAFFDIPSQFQVPEFGVSSVIVAATSLVGLAVIRRRFIA